MNTKPEEKRKLFLRKLSIARQDSIENQKKFLDEMLRNDVEYLSLMSKSDELWIIPLAKDLHLSAIIILTKGMHYKLRFFDKEIFDEKNNKMICVEYSELVPNESIFNRNNALEDEIHIKIKNNLPNFDCETLHRFYIYFNDFFRLSKGGRYKLLYESIDKELLTNRGNDNKSAIHLAYKFRFGDEKNGFFIDPFKAKQCYDIAEVKGDDILDKDKDYNPEEDFRLLINLIEEKAKSTKVMTFLKGADVPKIKYYFNQMLEIFGQDINSTFNLPLSIVMKQLVGTSAYVGNITEIEEKSEEEILIIGTFKGCDITCLMYAFIFHHPSLTGCVAVP